MGRDRLVRLSITMSRRQKAHNAGRCLREGRESHRGLRCAFSDLFGEIGMEIRQNTGNHLWLLQRGYRAAAEHCVVSLDLVGKAVSDLGSQSGCGLSGIWPPGPGNAPSRMSARAAFSGTLLARRTKAIFVQAQTLAMPMHLLFSNAAARLRPGHVKRNWAGPSMFAVLPNVSLMQRKQAR